MRARGWPAKLSESQTQVTTLQQTVNDGKALIDRMTVEGRQVVQAKDAALLRIDSLLVQAREHESHAAGLRAEVADAHRARDEGTVRLQDLENEIHGLRGTVVALREQWKESDRENAQLRAEAFTAGLPTGDVGSGASSSSGAVKHAEVQVGNPDDWVTPQQLQDLEQSYKE